MQARVTSDQASVTSVQASAVGDVFQWMKDFSKLSSTERLPRTLSVDESLPIVSLSVDERHHFEIDFTTLSIVWIFVHPAYLNLHLNPSQYWLN